MKDKIEILRDFLDGYKEKSLEGAATRGKLIARKMLFVEHHLIQFYITVRAFIASQCENSNQSGYFEDIWKSMRHYMDLSKPDNRKIIDGLINPVLSDSDDVLQDIYKQFLSLENYNPPTGNPIILLMHLIALYIFFKYLAIKAPLNVLSQFDLVMAQLSFRVGHRFLQIAEYGKDQDRVYKGRKAKQLKRDLLQQNAIETFYGINIKGMSKNKIAKTIQKEMIKEGMLPKPRADEKPKDHTKSIIRYLEADDNVRDILKKIKND